MEASKSTLLPIMNRTSAIPAPHATKVPNSCEFLLLLLCLALNRTGVVMKTKSFLKGMNILRSQYFHCQSGYRRKFLPLSASMYQLVQPNAQTNFFSSFCIHSLSRRSASVVTATVSTPRPLSGLSDDSAEGYNVRISGRIARSVKFI